MSANDRGHARDAGGAVEAVPSVAQPGRRTLTRDLPAYRGAAPAAAALGASPPAPLWDDLTLQLDGDGEAPPVDDDAARATAHRGLDGASQALPHADAIQRSFGRHDVGGIHAHLDAAAAAANGALGARGYALGDHVAFAAAPDLHLAAHEAAHVVQQRGGVQLSRGVGRSGDVYERHADAVADRVVRGESAEALLDTMAGGGGGGASVALQRDDDDEPGLLDRAVGVAREAAIAALLASPAGAPAVAVLRRLRPAWIVDVIEQLPEASLRAFLEAVLTAGLGPFARYLIRPELIERVIRHGSERLGRELLRVHRDGVLPYLRQRLTELWPVGVGFRLEASAGITFGYPIHIGAGGGLFVMHSAPDTFQVQRRGQMILAADTGAGAGVDVGVGRVGIHARAEAEAMGGHRINLREQYDLPVVTDQAFAAFLSTMWGHDTMAIGTLAGELNDDLRGLDPENYLTEREMNYEMFGQADANAEASLVSGREGRTTSRWGGDGQGLTSQRSSVADDRRPWYLEILPGVSADLGIELAAGVGVQMQPQPQSERPRRGEEIAEPQYVDLEFSAAASILMRAGAVVPFISQYIPRINAQPGIGLKVTFRVNMPNSGEEPNPRFLRAVLALTEGDIDALSGHASETEIGVGVATDPAPDAEQTLDGVLRELAPDLHHRQRLVLAGAAGLPESWRNWIGEQMGIGRTLSEVAFELEGQLRFELHIDAAHARQIMNHMAAAARDVAGTGTPRQIGERIYNDFIAFIEQGTIPSYLQDVAQALRVLGTTTVRELKISGDIGLHLAGDARAAFGAKLRLRADGRAGARFEYDLLTEGATTAARALTMARAYLRDHDTSPTGLLELLRD